MAPPAADIDVGSNNAHKLATPVKAPYGSRLPEPLRYSGSLDSYENFDVTAVIGREFPTLQLSEILHDDNKIRDLAILGKSLFSQTEWLLSTYFDSIQILRLCLAVSQRGVVFFRNQDLAIDDQKLLGQRLGELTGKPSSSKLHRHALSNSKRGIAVDENGKLDDEVSVISSEQNRKFYKDRFTPHSKKLASEGWHAE